MVAGADTIQATIDSIASMVEPECPARVPERELAFGAQVQAMVDAVATDVQAMFDPIAAMVGLGDTGRQARRQDQGQGKPGHGDFG